jgi:hypothetical protein
MLTTQDFLLQYEKYSAEELYHAYTTQEDYSDKAKEALKIAINNQGGIESITNKLRQKQLTENEIVRIKEETSKLSVPGTEVGFLQSLIKSDTLTEEEKNIIIAEKFGEKKLEQEDQKIKPRTIWGSIRGGGIASIIGGVLWGLQMIQMHRMFYIFLIGLVMLCYSIIKFVTKQSKKNNAVFIATGISVAVALAIGELLFELFG